MNEKINHLREKADQLITVRKWNELIQVTTELIDIEKERHNKAIAYCVRGGAYSCKGEYERALEDLNVAIKLNPKDAYAYYGRGIAYNDKQDYDCSITDFSRVIELNPEYVAEAYYARGIAYTKKKGYDCAIDDFNEVVKLNPEHVNAYYARGIAYVMKPDFGNAFKKFNTVAEKYPTLKTSEPFVYIASQISTIDSLRESEKIEAFAIYINLLNIVSKIRLELFYTSKELASGVAHYTSLRTLENLSKSKSRFRLYNADYMNDPEEGQVFFKIMNNEYGINVKKDFYENKDKSYRSPAYIGSFVLFEGEDKLSLWRTYGKHETEEEAGACLIFNDKQCFSESMPYQYGRMTESLQTTDVIKSDAKKDHNDVQKLALYKIYYQEESDDELKKELQKLRDQLKNTEEIINNELQENKIKEKLEILRKQLKIIEKIINNGVREEKIKEELEILVKQLKITNQFIEEKVPEEEETKNTLRRLVREFLDSIRFLFKERYYRDERERRVIRTPFDEKHKISQPEILPDTDNIPPRFYMEAPENFRFNKVILGPNAKHVQQWQRWFKAKDGDVEIKQSKIPYRKL